MKSDSNRTVEQRLRAAVESAPSGLLMIDSDGRIVLVNGEVERLFGYAREELLGKPVEILVPERYRREHPQMRGAFLRDPRMRKMGAGRDLYGRTKAGVEIPIEIGLTPVATEEGMFVLSSIVDISERKRAEERFRVAVESSPNGMLMIDREGGIVLVNREIERLFGYSRAELLGRSIETLVPKRYHDTHPFHRDQFFDDPQKRAMGAGRELHGVHRDGSEFPLEIGLNPIQTEEGLFVLGSVVDIRARKHAEDERRRLETQLRQAQKMEAIGTLAGGVAHDFNNILGTIQGYAELVQGAACLGPTERADISEVLRAAERGRSLVQQILTFSRRKDPVRKPIALAQVVGEATQLLRATLPATIAMTVRIEDSTPRVNGDSTSIHQVIMNLATNAAHAMPQGGALEVVTDGMYLCDSFVRAHPELAEGRYGRITVRDNGCGMDPSVASRAFEPFFTTKEPGRGTGLGLSMVHAIMRDHGGLVLLESQVDKGTVVRCYFPAIEADQIEAPAADEVIPRGEGEHVLVVDDEPALAKLGQRRLEELGYRVTVVSDSGAAIERLRNSRDEFHALVTDFFMPKLSGLDLAKQVAALGGNVAIVLMTGVICDLPHSELEAAGVRCVLAKPVSTGELARALRTALAARRKR